VKKLLKTPKVQKSPKNDLSDVKGVKLLLKTPKVQKSPLNDVTNINVAKKLRAGSRLQKSPLNDLTDVRGVKALMGSPKTQKPPLNDLSDLVGVQDLFASPKVEDSPNMFETPRFAASEKRGQLKRRKKPPMLKMQLPIPPQKAGVAEGSDQSQLPPPRRMRKYLKSETCATAGKSPRKPSK
jgi:hypothetical protein